MTKATDTSDSASKHAPRIRILNIIGIIAAVVLAILAIVNISQIIEVNDATHSTHDRYTSCRNAANDFLDGSDELTLQSRMFAFTGRVQHLDAYLDEYARSNRRAEAVETIGGQVNERSAHEDLYNANILSNSLAQRELYAMRLAAEAYSIALPAELAEVQISDEDAALSNDEKLERANDMLLGKEYVADKALIVSSVDECISDLFAVLQQEEEQNAGHLNSLLNWLRIFVLVLLAIIGCLVLLNLHLVILPMDAYAKRIRASEPLELTGSEELRYVARSYNQMYEESKRTTELLKQEAETDALTGLYNRGMYDRLLDSDQNIALVLADVDNFKNVNDEYGHEKGDAVLKHVAHVLSESFSTDDHACRIGGDEFAVIVSDVTPSESELVRTKVEIARKSLLQDDNSTPMVTLSIGISFSEDSSDSEELYRKADEALYEVKNRGRNGYAFYQKDE